MATPTAKSSGRLLKSASPAAVIALKKDPMIGA
jgi:hypothetical protein